uniref:Uncharacterized protein n=1 Tax=Cucumis melo subsp. melo TaxID=412675 RepID=E5GBG9_CUCME|nr:hypothetical protein [Cucumis melo subsp. melo]
MSDEVGVRWEEARRQKVEKSFGGKGREWMGVGDR